MKFRAMLLVAIAVDRVHCMRDQGVSRGRLRACGAVAHDRITEFLFAENGTFTISYYDGKQANGTYAASGDQITLNELNEDSPCIDAPATMSWTSSGDSLTLKTVEDQNPPGKISFYYP